jgi:hypothetical protein
LLTFLSNDCEGRDHSAGRRHTILLLYVSFVGLPVLSLAGVNRARDLSRRQVVASSAAEPLDEVTVQLVTRPLAPISSLNPVVPDSPERIAEAG